MRKRIFAAVMALCVMCGFFVAASAQSVTRLSATSPFTGFIGSKPAIKSNVPALPTGKVTGSVRPPMRAEADAPVIYGSLITGDGLDLSAGVYSFPASSDLTLTPVNIWAKLPANAGGVYVNGKYYYFHYFDSSGALFTYFVVADASTWEILSSTRNRDIGPCTDLAYDPITETIYGCFSKSTKDGYLFGSVSKTGAVTQIAEMTNPLYTLACDVDGTLYAINSSGVLCTVDKENGKLTTVGSTGIRPDYVQSMTFDMASRRLFWAACTETSSGLYEIAPATGKATLIKKFDNGEEFCGIYTLSQGADAKAPGELTDFKAEYDITTPDGVNVSFKMPAKAFDGTALSGKIDWIVSLDDKDLDLGEANPGETVTLSFSSGTVGMHTISAFARNSSGKGPQASERKWQLTENSTNNYFIEPDFHYTIIDTDGKESDSVIKVEQKEGSAWASLKAVGAGTAIVLVTYDAIGLNFYASSTGVKQAYMGGEYWSAIWPENTAAYVITVGQGKSAVDPQMLVNEKYNQGALKVAGNYVDAEHDVFYYLDTEEGYSYTFRADGAKEVKIAYPVIGEQMATYSGFGDAGVTANADGSYTVLLKEGRQIVRMTDASGKSAYQVFTAKKCHREIVNVNRPGSKIFQPGDQLAIQYSGLRHPANKLAGIYNMSAYVTYNGVPNGTSLILSANQYKFGSSDKAQAVTLDIPADHDVAAEPELTFTEGVILVNGYGDPIGNHRIIDPRAGRSPNFTAVPHKTYFGAIPDVRVPVTAVRNFPIKVDFTAENGKVTVSYLGKELEADDEGLYEGTYGFYDVVATAPGNRCQRLRYNIPDDAEGLQTFNIEPVKLDDDWFGTNSKEPATDADGRYVISSASELAWFRDKVNAGDAAEPLKATLTADIDLGDYDWTPIGDTSHPFTGEFTGNGHTVRGLYIDQPGSNMLGLFGSVKGTDADHRAHISGVTVYGYVNGNMTLGGLAAHVQGFADIDACANYAEIHGARNGVGGLIGALTQKTSTVTNCYNAGSVFAESTRGGIVGNLSNGCDVTISNVFNVGVIEDHANGHAIAGSTYAVDNITNAYAIADYAKTGGYTLVTEARMASGEIAYRLGSAFGQKIGEDAHPVFSDDKVYKVTYSVVDAVAAAAEDEGLTLYSNADLPTRIGEQEVLWYADAALTQPVTVIDADSRLYVKNLYTYTLTYVLDGETYKEETHYEGEAIAPEADPVREGYTFSGWEGVPEVMPAGNVTVTGSFAVNSYRLTLYLNNEVYKDEMLEYGAAVVVDEPEVPEGCRFDGWTDAIPATMPAHDVDIHGTYTELSGIAGILVDADEKVTVCTPSGIVLYADRPWGDVRDTLAPGVYIVRSAAAVTKVCVK